MGSGQTVALCSSAQAAAAPRKGTLPINRFFFLAQVLAVGDASV
jgi:hypothetical protein